MYLLELKNKPEEGRVCQLPHSGHFTGAVNTVAQYSQSIPLNLCPQSSQTNFVIPLNISYSFRVWTIAPNRPVFLWILHSWWPILVWQDKGIDKLQPLQVHNGSWIADTLQFLCLPYSSHVIIFVLRLQRYYEAVPNSGMADKKKETLFPNLSCIKDKITENLVFVFYNG